MGYAEGKYTIMGFNEGREKKERGSEGSGTREGGKRQRETKLEESES